MKKGPAGLFVGTIVTTSLVIGVNVGKADAVQMRETTKAVYRLSEAVGPAKGRLVLKNCGGEEDSFNHIFLTKNGWRKNTIVLKCATP